MQHCWGVSGCGLRDDHWQPANPAAEQGIRYLGCAHGFSRLPNRNRSPGLNARITEPVCLCQGKYPLGLTAQAASDSHSLYPRNRGISPTRQALLNQLQEGFISVQLADQCWRKGDDMPRCWRRDLQVRAQGDMDMAAVRIVA